MKHLSSPTVDQIQAPRSLREQRTSSERIIGDCVEAAVTESRFRFSVLDLERYTSELDVTDRNAGLCPNPSDDLLDK